MPENFIDRISTHSIYSCYLIDSSAFSDEVQLVSRTFAEKVEFYFWKLRFVFGEEIDVSSWRMLQQTTRASAFGFGRRLVWFSTSDPTMGRCSCPCLACEGAEFCAYRVIMKSAACVSSRRTSLFRNSLWRVRYRPSIAVHQSPGLNSRLFIVCSVPVVGVSYGHACGSPPHI